MSQQKKKTRLQNLEIQTCLNLSAQLMQPQNQTQEVFFKSKRIKTTSSNFKQLNINKMKQNNKTRTLR